MGHFVQTDQGSDSFRPIDSYELELKEKIDAYVEDRRIVVGVESLGATPKVYRELP